MSIVETLPPAKSDCQAFLCWQEMDMEPPTRNHGAMKKPPRAPAKRPEKPVQPVFVGAWFRTLGKKPADCVREAGVNEGYLSELINNRKLRPTPYILTKIGKFLGIEWTDLYKPPPPGAAVSALQEYSPETLATLRTPPKH